MYSDYHIHSDLSFDSDEPAINQVKKAIKLGMKQICFTEHVDIGWNINGETSLVDIKKYNKTIADLRNQFGNEIEILQGIEVGLTDTNIDETQEFLDANNFDYVIASIHEIQGADPYYYTFWEGQKENDLIQQYFEATLRLIPRIRGIDTLGHLDYITRYAPSKKFNPDEYKNIIAPILEYLIANDIALEINTSNLAKGNEQPNPHTTILKWYSELGGQKVVVGSDAHKSEFVGFGFDIARDLIEKYHLINIKH